MEKNSVKENKVNKDTRDIAKMIFLHYRLRNVENMFFVAVVNYLKKNNLEKSTLEIVENISLIEERCPDWIYEVKNKSGKILRMNK